MTGRHARPDPVLDDRILGSLLVLVAENLGYTCAEVRGDLMVLEGPTRLGVDLRLLRQLARLAPRDDWPSLVSDHVTTIVTAIEEPLDLSEFDLAQHLLRTRLYPATVDDGTLAARPFAPGLAEVVVVDTPTTVRTVTRAEMRTWPVSGDALFMLGRANVRADGPLDAVERTLGGVPVSVLSGWTFYTGTHLAWLEEYLPALPHGALVTVGNRGGIVTHPLRPTGGIRARYRAVAAAVTHMRAHARGAFERGPGSLSPDVYWWRSGELAPLETRYEEDALVLPEELVSVLASTAAET